MKELKELDSWERGEEYMDHLEAKFAGEPDFFKRMDMKLDFYAEEATMRMHRAGISGQAMLDAQHYLKQFMRLLWEKNLWRGEAVDYFSHKLKIWKERNFPEEKTEIPLLGFEK